MGLIGRLVFIFVAGYLVGLVLGLIALWVTTWLLGLGT
jgi:hypothetical protein